MKQPLLSPGRPGPAPGPGTRPQIKTFLVTKLFLILLTLACLQVNARAYSQQITLSEKNAPLQRVIKEIGRQSGYQFFYNTELLQKAKPVTVVVKNASLETVLEQCFQGQPLTYAIVKNTILVEPRKTGQALAPPVEVSGTVADEKGSPLPGVSVLIKGSSQGTTTDENGGFRISADEQAVLVFTFVGFEPQEIAVKGRTRFQVSLQPKATPLNEVAVTALGIRRETKSLGYAVQEVKGEVFKKVKEPNIMSSLTGRVAGLTVFNRTGTFQAPAFNLRGETNVLFVVDGVQGADTWSINPEDIEKIDVIKGATGAALYGAAGQNGVIMITTKKGGNNPAGLAIELNSSSVFNAGYVALPEYQTRYGQGFNGEYSYVDGKGGGVFDGNINIWGPELNMPDPTTPSGYVEIPQFNSPRDPQTGELIPLPWVTRTRNPIKEFMDPGYTLSNSVSLGGNNQQGDFRIGFGNIYRKGQVPGTDVQNNNIDFSGGYKFYDKLRIDGKVSYNKLASDNYETAEYSFQNYVLNIGYNMGPNVALEDLKNYWEPGQEGYKQYNYIAGRNNPYWLLKERTQKYNRDRITSWAKAEYEFSKDLRLMGRVSAIYNNTFTEFRENKGNVMQSDGKGRYTNSMSKSYDLNADWLLRYNKRLLGDKLGLDLAAGGNTRTLSGYSLSGAASALVVPGLYNLSNRESQHSASNGENKKIINSFYSTANFDYRNRIFLNLTGRNDWSSALSEAHNSYFYPSVSLSGVVSEMVNLPALVSYAKLRASWAQGRLDIPAYFNLPVYGIGSWNNTPTASFPGTLINPELKAELLNTYEAGADVRFFSNRLGFDMAYYERILTDEVISVPLSAASGYTAKRINARQIKTRGFEYALTATPVKNQDFEWTTVLNMSYYKKYLEELEPGATHYQGFFREGERLGRYRGRKFQRNEAGDIIYENGLPLVEDEWQWHGYMDPRMTWGFMHSFRYRNWTMSAAIDGRIGGLIYNYNYGTMMVTGAAKETAEGNLREQPFIGDGAKVVGGEVIRDERGNIVFDSREYAPNDVEVKYYDWVQRTYGGMHEMNLFDGSFVKVRELTLGYSLPATWLSRLPVKGASFSVVGRNLWLKTRVPYSDPDIGADDQSQGPSPRNIGFNLNITL